jgi:hypothetical protein
MVVTVGPLPAAAALLSVLPLKAAFWGVLVVPVVVVVVLLSVVLLGAAACCWYCPYAGSDGSMMLTTPLVRAGTAEVGTVRAGTVVVVTPVDGSGGMVQPTPLWVCCVRQLYTQACTLFLWEQICILDAVTALCCVRAALADVLYAETTRHAACCRYHAA